jgi:hypothetical protein
MSMPLQIDSYDDYLNYTQKEEQNDNQETVSDRKIRTSQQIMDSINKHHEQWLNSFGEEA